MSAKNSCEALYTMLIWKKYITKLLLNIRILQDQDKSYASWNRYVFNFRLKSLTFEQPPEKGCLKTGPERDKA